MGQTELKYVWINDEDAEIYLDGKLIYTMSHGPHGWDGMIGISEALYAVADQLDWDIVVEGDPAI